jgi:hypothetical protein
MFWGSVYSDLNILIIASILVFVFSFFIYLKYKNILLGFVVLSVFLNIILHLVINFHFADFFGVMWLFKFSRDIWPYINLVLLVFIIISYIKQKNAKAK